MISIENNENISSWSRRTFLKFDACDIEDIAETRYLCQPVRRQLVRVKCNECCVCSPRIVECATDNKVKARVYIESCYLRLSTAIVDQHRYLHEAHLLGFRYLGQAKGK